MGWDWQIKLERMTFLLYCVDQENYCNPCKITLGLSFFISRLFQNHMKQVQCYQHINSAYLRTLEPTVSPLLPSGGEVV